MFKPLYALAGAALLLGACSETKEQAYTAPPTPAPQASTFMVFFDWDRSDLSPQALATVHEAAVAFKSQGQTRIAAIGHTDTSGPRNYNVALSLRRATVVKQALLREDVAETAIVTTGQGEDGLLVQTGDGVREPQNRRAEIIVGDGPVASAIFSDPASYCRALWDKNRQYQGGALDEALGGYRCEQGNYEAAIPALENGLIKYKIPLPLPGYRWPGRSIT
jgi:hypothetical protein